ncbi:hypothetical protein LEP1GSC041_1458 [Leptospira noguchii str. 2006001870]|nr:hypothetical protein LEP1GSC041_1458 [Leptospira noguchii str. 2006001870]
MKSEILIKLLQEYKITPTQLIANSTQKSLLLTIKVENLNKDFKNTIADFINLVPIQNPNH